MGDKRLGLSSIILMVSFGMAMSEHILYGEAPHISGISIECNTDHILVKINEKYNFNGIVYPKGLATNSSCLVNYYNAGKNFQYTLPLRACNTMSIDHDLDGIDYYNTLVIEPHHRLLTSMGKGFHIKCHYSATNATAHVTLKNKPGQPASSAIVADDLPKAHMKILLGREHPMDIYKEKHVKIGDFLTLKIFIEDQDTYGMKVTNCLVRDGIRVMEQSLIGNEGCPLDPDIFGSLEYNDALTKAQVSFPAHKFPLTASLYYQCNVKLCLKKGGGCDDSPPICNSAGENIRKRRRRRQTEIKDEGSLENLRLNDEDVRDRSVEVFGSVIVDEVDDFEDENEAPITTPSSDDEFCISTKRFAVAISIAGIILLLAVILLVACIVRRRRRRKGTSTNGSSLYSGPYSNHAYSRD